MPLDISSILPIGVIIVLLILLLKRMHDIHVSRQCDYLSSVIYNGKATTETKKKCKISLILERLIERFKKMIDKISKHKNTET